jgi:tetratricopeptide (TPR) repeat protein
MPKKPRDPAHPGTVGYKSPPPDKQFKPGASGNPRGRPKGLRNRATMTKDAFNRHVDVRSEGKTVKMRAVEAIFRVLTNKAAQGNTRAAALVDRLREMAGMDSDLPDEDWEKHRMRLPRGFVGDQMDLCRAAAREKERQRYLAMAELDANSSDPETRASNAQIPPAIKEGDRFATNREFDKALGSYRSQILLCKQELTADATDTVAQYNFRRTVARIGLVADTFLHEAQFAKALEVAEEAIAEGSSGFWTQPEMIIPTDQHNTIWIAVIRSLARMLLEPLSVASSQYFRRFQSDRRIAYTSWEYVILREFAYFRRMGYAHPTMDEVEKHFFEAGWVLDTKESVPAKINVGFEHADDIARADTLASQGKLGEAAALFRSILAAYDAAPRKLGADRSAMAEQTLVVARLGRLARMFLFNKKYGVALDCANEALEYDPYSISSSLARAHSLMFLNKPDEASAIYLGFAGIRMSGERWAENAIREDFDELRKAGLSHNLMEQIERQLRETPLAEQLSRNGGRSTILGEADQFSSPVPTPARRPRAINPDPPLRPLEERDDIGSGDELLAQGKLEEAVIVYQRCIERCDRTLANGNHSMRLTEIRHGCFNRIVETAFLYMLVGQLEKALESAEHVLSKLPSSPFAKIRRAHALMMSGKDDTSEVREVYLQQPEAKLTPELTRRELVLEDFKKMRECEREHPLMAEIEAILSRASPPRGRLIR